MTYYDRNNRFFCGLGAFVIVSHMSNQALSAACALQKSIWRPWNSPAPATCCPEVVAEGAFYDVAKVLRKHDQTASLHASCCALTLDTRCCRELYHPFVSYDMSCTLQRFDKFEEFWCIWYTTFASLVGSLGFCCQSTSGELTAAP